MPCSTSGCSAGTDAGAERGHIRVAVADFRDTRVGKKEHVDSGRLLESGPGGLTGGESPWWVSEGGESRMTLGSGSGPWVGGGEIY